MAEIRPRWEWRSFGRHFGGAEAQLATLTPGSVQESDETYLLSGAGDNVKVRDGLMDVKVLREVNADGLEQWTPVMKATFPLPAAEAAKVLESLRLPVPAMSRATFTLDEFLDQFAAPGGAIRVVKVHKRRTRYTVGGCMAELSDVVANGKPTRTIAVESEDAAAVMGAVRQLGLGGYVNTSYPVGLAALIDDVPTRYAVIDAGTNSIKFHIGERDREGRWHAVVDRAELTRLGEGLAQQGVISDAALERTAAAIAGMAEEAKRHGVRAIAAVGTAGLRIAKNEPQLRAKLWSNVAFLRRRFAEEGVDIGKSNSQVMPVMVNNDARVFAVAEKIQERGLFLNPVTYPAVPKHKSRLRISVSAAHTEEDLERAVQVIAGVLREEGICRR
jgi:exopolyphosphatase/guanosine-5'-triphosphate,3'-diphosphate pyrophosphatase